MKTEALMPWDQPTERMPQLIAVRQQGGRLWSARQSIPSVGDSDSHGKDSCVTLLSSGFFSYMFKFGFYFLKFSKVEAKQFATVSCMHLVCRPWFVIAVRKEMETEINL